MPYTTSNTLPLILLHSCYTTNLLLKFIEMVFRGKPGLVIYIYIICYYCFTLWQYQLGQCYWMHISSLCVCECVFVVSFVVRYFARQSQSTGTHFKSFRETFKFRMWTESISKYVISFTMESLLSLVI